MAEGASDAGDIGFRDPLGLLEEALAEAKPSPAPYRARRLQLQAVMAAVLGPDVGAPRLGRYVVEKRVGAGGMGVVFRGRDAETKAPVAIKVVCSDMSTERSRFEREAKVLQALDHPRVVRYWDHGSSPDGLDYLVMEWLSGCDLASCLVGQTQDVRTTLRLGIQLAEALLHAHQNGIVHRDLKPSNVFLVDGKFDSVKLIDFGIARAQRSTLNGAKLTATGALVGSPHYMAPEQLRGHHDQRTDVYGLGATLFEALSGRPPFVGENIPALLLSVAAELPPSLCSLRDDIPPAVDALVSRMLAKELSDRPRDMAAVVLEFSDLLAGSLRAGRKVPVLSRAERTFSETMELNGGSRKLGLTADGDDSEFVGRVREVAQMVGILAESVEEEFASLVLLSGGDGIGKTHLLRKVWSSLPSALSDSGWTAFFAAAQREERGVPLSALRALLGRKVWGESSLDAACASFLALTELLVAPVAEERGSFGEVARRDPLLLADQLQLAWLYLLERASERGPVVMFLDDAESADAATLRFVDRALSHLSNCCFVVVLAGESFGAEWGVGSDLEAARKHTIHLGPLSARSTQRLVKRWSAASSVDEVAALARVASGNLAYLREVCREAGEGGRAKRVSMAEVMWERLHRLDAEGRRLLRAASIVGKVFWWGAVEVLLSVEPGDVRPQKRLERAISSGFLRRVPVSRLAHEEELEFESDLLRLAAYQLNTEEDLRVGHAAVARWLTGARGAFAAVIAGHFSAAGENEAALSLYLQAARAALSGAESETFDEYIAAAEVCSPNVAALAEIAELKAIAAFWRGQMGVAVQAAQEALGHLTRGTYEWFRTASLLVTAAGQCGDNGVVSGISAALQQTPSDSPAEREARLIALCRTCTQLENAEMGDRQLRLEIESESVAALRPDARAWLARARSVLVARDSFDASIEAMVTAHLAHLEAQDYRSAAQIGIFLGSYYVWSGAWERAAKSIEDALTIASRLGAEYLVVWGNYVRAKLEVETASFDAAMKTLEGVVESPVSSIRFRAGALVYGAIAAQKAGRFEEASMRARAASDMVKSPGVTRPALSALCRSLLSLGRISEAKELSIELSSVDTRGLIVEFSELWMLARFELAEALGEREAFETGLLEATNRIQKRAATLSDPLRRNDYLARPHLVAQTLERARRHGVLTS